MSACAMCSLSAFDQGYLLALLQADASLHAEGRGAQRRVVIEFEVGDPDLALRLATLLGGLTVSTRTPRPSNRISAGATYRTRLRGAAALDLLHHVANADLLTPERQDRVTEVLADVEAARSA